MSEGGADKEFSSELLSPLPFVAFVIAGETSGGIEGSEFTGFFDSPGLGILSKSFGFNSRAK